VFVSAVDLGGMPVGFAVVVGVRARLRRQLLHCPQPAHLHA